MQDQQNPGPLRMLAGPEEHGRALAEIVAQALGDSHAAARLIARGGLWVGRARVQDGSLPAQQGDEITIRLPPSGSYTTLSFDPAWIVYEDADLLAFNKPIGTYVDMTPWDVEGNLRVALHRFLAARDGAEPRIHPVHRLDRDTSGVLLFSKNPEVNSALQRAFAGGKPRKTYLCLCSGEPPEDQFELHTGHGRSAFGVFRVYPLDTVGQQLPNLSHVKYMHTAFTVERRLGDAALLHAFPHTGRTHQIRLHLAHIGHPLLGDTRYGGPDTWRGRSIPHQLLHAERLELPHPRGTMQLAFVAPTPEWATASAE